MSEKISLDSSVLFHNFIEVLRESRYLSISVMSVEGGRAVRPRLPLVSVVGPAVAVVVRRHRQQLRAVFRGLRLLRRAVLDLRRQYRQLLVAPCLLQAGRERHRGVSTFQIPSVTHDLRFVVGCFHGCKPFVVV